MAVLRYEMMKNEKIKEEQQPINVKNRAEDLYKMYILFAKNLIKKNKSSVPDFFSSISYGLDTDYKHQLITKLGLLQEILYYSDEKVKHDIEEA